MVGFDVRWGRGGEKRRSRYNARSRKENEWKKRDAAANDSN